MKDKEQKRIANILIMLAERYPKASIALQYSNALELLIAVILSAQCTDKMVNIVTAKLFKKYKTLDDYCVAKQEEFEQDIKSTGFYKSKTHNILATVKIIKEKHHGEVPSTMEELIALSGVARKTANIVLGNAFQVVEGIAVDTHVNRISQRLRLVSLDKIGGKKKYLVKKDGKEIVDFIKDADSNKIEQELMNVIPKSEWLAFTYKIIELGRELCKAQNPKCTICPLRVLCPVHR